MTPDDPNTWREIFNLVGPWGTVAVAMGLFLWRVLKWLQPLGERIVEAHLTMVSKLTENDDVQTDCLRAIQSSIETDAGGHVKTHDKLDEVHEDVRAIRGKVERRA